MSWIRQPDYYKDFQCIGGDCTDNCCIGWEIDIDEDTLSYYQNVKGSFGKRLRDNMILPASDSEENAHFCMDASERCHFLNDRNLCDIYIKLGEEHLSQICTDHPRFYEWFTDGQEKGLGLCCEAAAKLILHRHGALKWNIQETDDLTETAPEDLIFLEQTLFSMRETMFSIIVTDTFLSFDEKIDALYRKACAMQDRYDALLYGFDDIEPDHNTFSFSDCFWQEHFLSALLEGCLSLEINDKQWKELLTQLKAELPDFLQTRSDFLEISRDNRYMFDNLLIYFIYRYFMKTLEDDLLLEKVQFALYSVCLIQLIIAFYWYKNHSLTEWELICCCKSYSREMEYNTDNIAFLSSYSISEK